MYGMVNEGIRTFIEDNFGAEAWRSICDDAEIEMTQFDRLGSYDDSVTYSLVGAVAKHTKLTPEKVLNVFGEYWVDYAGQSGLGNLLKLSGNSFVERVKNLDDMHERILMTMPNLKPPSFELEEVEKDTFDLYYYSDRPGLGAMVIGLLHGLADQTGDKITVEHTQERSAQSDPDVFRIVLKS
ncbi:MAG: heme NO-binding domain-containing protein [Pseudomonadota bacterium]